MTSKLPAYAGNSQMGIRGVVGALLVCALFSSYVQAQTLRFGNHREVEVPDYATIKIGPFYSQVEFSQTAAYRYTRTEGSGTDFIFSNNKGSIVEDGHELPLVSELTANNYLIINRDTDLEFSITATYMYFPLGTQEDEFEVDLGDEGAEGNFSLGFKLSETLNGTLYDDISLSTDYVDSRGQSDPYGGDRYEVLENTVGLQMDWLITKYLNVPLTLERTDTMPFGDDFEEQEQVSTTPTIGLEYEVTPYLVVGLNSSHEVNEYPASERADTTITDNEVFAKAKLTMQSQLRASVGYSFGESDSVEGQESLDPESTTGELRVRTELSESTAHEIYAERTLEAGYLSDFDITDVYGYDLFWKGDLTSIDLTTALTDVTPSGGEAVTPYSDWLTTFTYNIPLTHVITLVLETGYDIRENGEADEDPETVQPVDTTENYETWISRASIDFEVMEDLTSTVSYEHMERYSDVEALAYGRDIAAIEFTYTHAF